MDNFVFKISWERYLIQFMIWFLVFALLWALKGLIGWIAVILILAWTVWIVIQVLENYVTKVIVDDDGVWISSGLFPWNKGYYGLNWRDISGATFRTGFLSWVLKSYTITVNHRYTRESHLIIPNLANGHHMVELINDIVAQKDLY